MENIVLLHAALGSHQDMEPLANALKTKGINTFSFSFSGHGNMPFKTEFNIEVFAQELEDFIRSNHLQGTKIIGYSMGGFVALHSAATHPELIGKIITLGTKFNWSAESLALETARLNPEIIRQKVPAFAKVLENKHGAHWQQLLIRTQALMEDIHQKKYLKPTTLGNIQIPVRLGLGDNDQMVSYEETKAVYTALPNAQMYLLPGCKHAIESAPIALLAEIIQQH
ncbi:MAG: alpha/beta hydrolase [Bacteroidia bacterium]|nr:alpha/beta hydrolase [Bacteroidia bacterium]